MGSRQHKPFQINATYPGQRRAWRIRREQQFGAVHDDVRLVWEVEVNRFLHLRAPKTSNFHAGIRNPYAIRRVCLPTPGPEQAVGQAGHDGFQHYFGMLLKNGRLDPDAGAFVSFDPEWPAPFGD